MKFAWYDAVGILGVSFVLGTYLALQMRKLAVDAPAYSTINACGAVFILVSLYHNFNLSSFIIEFAWLMISIFGMVQAFRARR